MHHSIVETIYACVSMFSICRSGGLWNCVELPGQRWWGILNQHEVLTKREEGPMKKMFTLTIIDNGRTFSVGNLSNFFKGDGKAEGSGKLFE